MSYKSSPSPAHLQQYHYQEDDSPPLDQGFPRLTNEVRAPELVHVSEKNLSEIENVHGYVSHAHISPLKVSLLASTVRFQWGCFAPHLTALTVCIFLLYI